MVGSNEIMENVLAQLAIEMNCAESRDTINKLYRQARVWVRFHCYYGNGCTVEEAHKTNAIIKQMRWQALANIGETLSQAAIESGVKKND